MRASKPGRRLHACELSRRVDKIAIESTEQSTKQKLAWLVLKGGSVKTAFSFVLVFFFLEFKVWAQLPTPSLEGISSRTAKGDSIEVTLLDGMTIRGRFDSVTSSTLRLTRDRTVQELPGTTVSLVKKRQADSLWNGLLIGLGAGIAAHVITCSGDDPERCSGETGLVVLLFEGSGAGLGALVDHAIQRYDTVYSRQTTENRRNLKLSPLVSKETRGLRLSISF